MTVADVTMNPVDYWSVVRPPRTVNIGDRFGKLVVIGRSDFVPGSFTRVATSLWNVRCDCGTEKIVRGNHLTSGHTRSCGCVLAKRQAREARLQGIENERRRRHGNLCREIAEGVALAMAEDGLTCADVAHRAGVFPHDVEFWLERLRGGKPVHLRDVALLAMALGREPQISLARAAA